MPPMVPLGWPLHLLQELVPELTLERGAGAVSAGEGCCCHLHGRLAFNREFSNRLAYQDDIAL